MFASQNILTLTCSSSTLTLPATKLQKGKLQQHKRLSLSSREEVRTAKSGNWVWSLSLLTLALPFSVENQHFVKTFCETTTIDDKQGFRRKCTSMLKQQQNDFHCVDLRCATSWSEMIKRCRRKWRRKSSSWRRNCSKQKLKRNLNWIEKEEPPATREWRFV